MLRVPLRVALGHECHHQDKCCSAFTWDDNKKTTATAAIAGVKVKITLAAAEAAATAAGRRIFLQNVKGKNVDVCDPGAENRAEAADAIGAGVGAVAAAASVAVGVLGLYQRSGSLNLQAVSFHFLIKTP